MPADPTLAQAAQRIAELEAEIAAQQLTIDGLRVDCMEMSDRASAANARLAALQPRANRADELEKLLAPPRPDSGIVTVTYSDGRVKYAAPDGSKYPMVADAQHRAQILALMKIGLGEAQAEVLLQHGDEALKALTTP
jgi:uncharacterized coiled-coil protein SlyX